jgi:excisionase family DNA binding protein
MNSKLLLKIPEVCEATGLGRSTIYKLLDQPDGLATVRVGRAVRIRAVDLEEWVGHQAAMAGADQTN